MGSEDLNLQQASRWYQCCWSTDHILSSMELRWVLWPALKNNFSAVKSNLGQVLARIGIEKIIFVSSLSFPQHSYTPKGLTFAFSRALRLHFLAALILAWITLCPHLPSPFINIYVVVIFNFDHIQRLPKVFHFNILLKINVLFLMSSINLFNFLLVKQ